MVDHVDPTLLARIAALDLRVKEACDLIPLERWGLDESVKEKLRQNKHRIVAQHLWKKERDSFTNARKQRLGRMLGAVPTKVSEVLKYLSENTRNRDSTASGALPTRTQLQKKVVKSSAKQPATKKTPQPVKSMDSKVKKTDDGGDSESEEETVVESKPKHKPHSVVMKRKESEETVNNEDGAEPDKKKSKLQEELIDLNKIETKNLDPVEARNIAMMKLKKKIAIFKATRHGKKTVEDYENKRKMKRKMSKLQLKQKKNEEKIQGKKGESGTAKVKKEMKVEALQADDAAPEGITYSKFDFIVKEDKKNLTKKEKRDKFTGKNYKRLLEKAEHRQETIEKIREKNPEKADRIEENIKWNKVIKLAEGNKVKGFVTEGKNLYNPSGKSPMGAFRLSPTPFARFALAASLDVIYIFVDERMLQDNVELLKKAAKRKEKTKERSSKKWDARLKEVEEKKGKKQDTRNINLKKRIDDARKKKMEKLKKKGRIL